jgi:hypothetical protein
MTTIAADERPRALTADQIDQVAGGVNTPANWHIKVAGMDVSWANGVATVGWQSGGKRYELDAG